MKRKKINFDQSALYGDFESKEADKENALIKAAAVLDDFLLKETKDWLNAEVDNEELEELISNSHVTGSLENELIYSLNDDVRTRYLEKMVADNALTDQLNFLLENNNNSDTSKHALKFLRKDLKPLTEQSLEELALSMKVSKWVEEIDRDYTHPGHIYAEMKRRALIKPFEELTQNFQGRDEELDKIKEYVDWLPKSGILNITGWVLREVFSWHKKKPLLITGIGGIGKSTLVAKFILDHIKDNNKLPFVYIDFDKSSYSIEEPLFVLYEALKQLKIQFSDLSEVFEAVMDLLNDRVFYKDGRKKRAKSTATSRSKVYHSILERLAQFRIELSDMKQPILVVFDSFEELQYRGANKSEFLSFLKTIREISERIPRIRPVFVGRAEIKFEEIKFQTIKLEAFDKTSSNGYLEKLGVENKSLREQIFVNFGGNPLTLQLAASLAKQQNLAFSRRLNTPKAGFLFNTLDKSVVQKELVIRNLDHIHDAEVRKIAMPGLLVRKINADVIMEILAEPCGLGKITKNTAKRIFESLSKETFLIRSGSKDDALIFRPELRKAMEEYIIDLDPENAKLVHENAIRYYEGKEKQKDQAEYIYHRLKRGDDPEFISRDMYLKVSKHLDRSLDELPLTAQVYLAELRGSKVSEEKLKKVKITDWENYYAKIIRDGLKSDVNSLRSIEKELKLRKERSYGNNLSYWEARLYQRLNKLSRSTAILDKAIRENQNDANFSAQAHHKELSIVKIENLEYQLKFKEALTLCESIRAGVTNENFPFIYFQLWVLRSRLFYRLNLSANVEDEASSFNLNLQEKDTYKSYESYYNTSLYENEFPFNTLQEKEYKRTLDQYKSRYNNLEKLEGFSNNYIGANSHELTEPGVFNIVVVDIFNRSNSKILGRALRKADYSKKRELVGALANLYPTIDETRRLLSHAGIYYQSIAFASSALQNWFNILTEVEKMNKLDDLYKVILQDYPETEVADYISESMRGSSNSARDYSRLIKELVRLYPSIEKSKYILDYSGLSENEIQFSTNAEDNWHNILTAVERTRELEKLLQAIVDESQNDRIIEVIRNETSYKPLVDATQAFRKELRFDNTRLKQLLELGRLDEWFTRVRKISSNLPTDVQNTILSLSARFSENKNANSAGLITPEAYRVGNNRITVSLLHMTNQLESMPDVQATISRLSQEAPTLTNQGQVNVMQVNDFEHIFKQDDDIVQITWLERALEASKAVCKVILNNGLNATGFLIGGKYVLTNNHVISSDKGATNARLIFEMPEGDRGHDVEFLLDPQKTFVTNKNLDYSLVHIQESDILASIKSLRINPKQLPSIKDRISIIQYPSGHRKKSIIADKVIDVREETMYYHGNTENASSGSPIFNKNWEVIAIHHAYGQINIGEQNESLSSNEGILMKAIVEDLKQKGINIDFD